MKTGVYGLTVAPLVVVEEHDHVTEDVAMEFQEMLDA